MSLAFGRCTIDGIFLLIGSDVQTNPTGTTTVTAQKGPLSYRRWTTYETLLLAISEFADVLEARIASLLSGSGIHP